MPDTAKFKSFRPSEYQQIVLELANHGLDCKICDGKLYSDNCEGGKHLMGLYLEAQQRLEAANKNARRQDA